MGLHRAIVLSLEGFPLALLEQLVADGVLPRTAELLGQGALRPLDGGLPVEPLSAWTTFATGVGPGDHGVYGFVDRRPVSWDIETASARRRSAVAIWERLSRLGQSTCVMNLPGTFPPRPGTGVVVAGFPAPNLTEACSDDSVVDALDAVGYRLDVDGRRMFGPASELVADVGAVLGARERALFALLGLARKAGTPFDFVHLHLSAMDRAHLALWARWTAGDPAVRGLLRELYGRLDRVVGRLAAEAGDEAALIVVSDFGVAPIQNELQLGRWLEDEDFLNYAEPREGRTLLQSVDVTRTRAYALGTGRIYFNLAGRESGGRVQPGAEADALATEIAERLLALRDPAGRAVVACVHRGRELFGEASVHRAPDLVVEPHPGFQLRGTIGSEALWQRTTLTGMHTRSGGFLFVRGAEPDGSAGPATMLDAHRAVLSAVGLA